MSNHEIYQAIMRLVSLAVVALAAATVNGAERLPLPSFSATYQVRYGLLRGTMTLALDRREAGYVYETSLSPAGVATIFKRGAISERTALTTVNGAVWPLDYYSTDTIAHPVRHTSYIFDRRGGRVTGEYKSQQIDVAMQADGHNRISVHIAIMAALQSNAEIPGVAVFDRGRWKDYEFAISRDRTVSTRAGTFDTVEVSYASSDNERSWSIHFARELEYLPVMLVFKEDGKVKSRAQLTEYTIEQQGISGSE